MNHHAVPLSLSAVLLVLAVAYLTPPEASVPWAPAAQWFRETLAQARMIR